MEKKIESKPEREGGQGYEYLTRMLGLSLDDAQRGACGYLESKGYLFLAQFNLGDCVAKATAVLDQELTVEGIWG